jgi:hypothetical protein
MSWRALPLLWRAPVHWTGSGTNGGEITASGRESGINVFQSYGPDLVNYEPLNPDLEHVSFSPQRKP